MHRARIIETAGEVFGEAGFRGATIREIARRAGVGLGAVHYHFEDKADLYRAVCDYALARSIGDYRKAVESTSDPKLQLRRWLDVFLKNTFSGAQPDWQGRLVLRGMTEPGPELPEFIESLIRPHHRLLAGVMAELLNMRPDSDAVLEFTLFIFGQCFVHHHLRGVVDALRGRAYTEKDVAPLRDQIYQFIVAAADAHAVRRRKKRK
ncbi:MAG: CerR family C-terminal domain-containing protein [Planctomycetes bacterium]|nr:CerR family C-terminal domain-containing protein [Planctomycetota bacterium]